MYENKASFIGNVSQEPRVHPYGDGKQLMSFGIAVKTSYKQGDPPLWVKVTTFKDWDINNYQSMLTKGTKVQVSGLLKMDKYTDKEGVERSELVLIADDGMGVFARTTGGTTTEAPARAAQAAPDIELPDLDDELPPF